MNDLTDGDDEFVTPDGRPITSCAMTENRTCFRSYDEIPIGEWWGVTVVVNDRQQRQNQTGHRYVWA